MFPHLLCPVPVPRVRRDDVTYSLLHFGGPTLEKELIGAMSGQLPQGLKMETQLTLRSCVCITDYIHHMKYRL